MNSILLPEGTSVEQGSGDMLHDDHVTEVDGRGNIFEEAHVEEKEK